MLAELPEFDPEPANLAAARQVILETQDDFAASAGLLAQLVLQATGRLSAVFRRPGVLELTRIPSIMEKPIERGAAAVQSVEYVTIPALYFNEGRGSLDFGEWADASLSTRLFASIGVGLELMALSVVGAADAASARRDRGGAQQRAGA